MATAPVPPKYHFTGYNKFLDPQGYPAVAPPWGTLSAINLNTGEYVWQHSSGRVSRAGGAGMKNTGTENYGGPVVTAGGLVFIGATNFDKKFHAFDKATGALLWETDATLRRKRDARHLRVERASVCGDRCGRRKRLEVEIRWSLCSVRAEEVVKITLPQTLLLTSSPNPPSRSRPNMSSCEAFLLTTERPLRSRE